MQHNCNVSREKYDKINQYCGLLLKWNKTINLVSKSSLQELEKRHISDSIQLLNYIPDDKNISVIDFGSGAGFPGLIMSICGVKKVTLIESDSRKAAFLLQAAQISDEEIVVINDRIENIGDMSCDVVTSRAFADLNTIFGYSYNIKVKDKYLLHKGVTFEQEIRAAELDWLFKIQVHDSFTSNQGKILEISDLKPRRS
jgi:16S rRNA (guanine527-N7)-methyltransferase